MFQHNTLAISSDGLPLGLLDQITWVRPKDKKNRAKRETLDIAERESSRWIKSLINTVNNTPEGTKVVTLSITHK